MTFDSTEPRQPRAAGRPKPGPTLSGGGPPYPADRGLQ